MGLFNFLFPFKSSTPSVPPNDTIKDTHKDDTYLLKNNNVITVKDDDEFINVDLRKLSYAEAAALNNSHAQNEPISAANPALSSVDVLSDINCSATVPADSNVLDINHSIIDTDVSIPAIDASADASSHNLTDYQLNEVIQSQLLSNKNDQIEQLAEDFEKSNSLSKHSKSNKQHRKKKKSSKKIKLAV